MKKRTAIRAGLVLVTSILLCWVAYGLNHPPKRRDAHCQGVNTVRNVSIPLSSTSASPDIQTNRQK